MGLGDVAALVAQIEDGVRWGADIGVEGVGLLEGYGAARYGVNQRMLGVVDKLHKVYGWEGRGLVGLGVVGLRSWGVEMVERWGWGKGVLMGVARGRG